MRTANLKWTFGDAKKPNGILTISHVPDDVNDASLAAVVKAFDLGDAFDGVEIPYQMLVMADAEFGIQMTSRVKIPAADVLQTHKVVVVKAGLNNIRTERGQLRAAILPDQLEPLSEFIIRNTGAGHIRVITGRGKDGDPIVNPGESWRHGTGSRTLVINRSAGRWEPIEDAGRGGATADH